MLRRVLLFLVVTTLVACEEKEPITINAETGGTDAVLLITDDAAGADNTGGALTADAVLLDWQPVEPPEPELSREEICAQTAISQVEEYCDCFPDCCQNQRWYCPPNPRQTIDIMQVIVEICDENKVPCEFGLDPECPPPEILQRSDCYTAWECPPGSRGEFVEWFECQLEDGTLGRQRVLCDKGILQHGPCRPCEDEACDGEDNDCDGGIDEGRFPCQNDCGEGWGFCVNQQVVDCNAESPGDESCNFVDDDCDGLIDEGQRNACDECGPLQADECDGRDNDCDGLVDEELVRECETACERGIETCEDGNWISCTARQPAGEECDGEDNDCDGLVDEQLECLCTVNDVGNLMPCSEPPLRCGQGFKTCECVDPECTQMRVTDCAALCQYLPMPEPPACDPEVGMVVAQEACNNFDEDCDLEIDEELTQTCYTGDPDTLMVGVCVPGEAYCKRGSWGSDRNNRFVEGHCAGEVTPSPEICDGADNDCDGEVDYGEEIRDTDILFIIDWSASMTEEIRAVRVALGQFAQHFAAEEPLQWGMVVGPKTFRESDINNLVLVSDISPFDQFLDNFSNLGSSGMDGSLEMLLDAIYLTVRSISPVADLDLQNMVWWRNTASIPEKENFDINWREGSDRIVILFTDEEEQTYLKPADDPEAFPGPITQEYITSVVQSAINFKLYTFSRPRIGIPDDWEDLAVASGGVDFRLTSNPTDMYNDLMSIIDEACLPRQAEEQEASITYRSPYMYVSYSNGYDYSLGLCY